MIFTHRRGQSNDSSKQIYQKNYRRPKCLSDSFILFSGLQRNLLVSVKVLLNKAREETAQHSRLRGQPMLSMAASFSESLRSALDDFPSDVSREEYSIAHLAGDSDVVYANIPTRQIYKETMLSSLNFLSNYKIKSVEKEISLQNKQSDIYLLSRETIRRHKSKYDFLHIGLVQAHVVPLHRRGIKVKIVVCLRDSKFPNFKESVLAAFEANLDAGQTKFNWFPNFSSSLSDLAKSNGLVITVEPQGYKLAEGYEDSHMFAIGYRMCYKLMKGSPEPKSLFENPVLEVNTEKTKVLVPKPNCRN